MYFQGLVVPVSVHACLLLRFLLLDYQRSVYIIQTAWQEARRHAWFGFAFLAVLFQIQTKALFLCVCAEDGTRIFFLYIYKFARDIYVVAVSMF